MASKNETVAEVMKEVRYILALTGIDKSKSHLMGFFDRVEAAHGREVAELRECLKEAVFVMQTLFDKQMPKWRKALEGAAE